MHALHVYSLQIQRWCEAIQIADKFRPVCDRPTARAPERRDNLPQIHNERIVSWLLIILTQLF